MTITKGAKWREGFASSLRVSTGISTIHQISSGSIVVNVKVEGGEIRYAATDLSNHLGCAHRSTLAYEEAIGCPRGRTSYDPVLDVLADRGRAHEAAYAEHLSENGRRAVVRATDVASTLVLLAQGAEVIAQAHLSRGSWNGCADFLVRVEASSSSGWTYEIHDTKLSAESRAEAVLQLCVYAEMLAALGHEPEILVIVKPGSASQPFETDRLRFAEYAAIFRMLRRDLEEHVPDTQPEPRSHCNTCRWYPTCERQWRDEDHLTLVAGSGASQRRELMEQHIETVERLAVEPRPLRWKPKRGIEETYERLGHQAELQVQARATSIPPVYRLEPVAGRGLARLPAPSRNDVFLDLEGDPFIGGGGREFLFGWVIREGDSLVYHKAWGLEEADERSAFLALLEAVKTYLAADPDMHVYHFSPYEPTALKRLMGRHAVGDAIIDDLLRGHRFVDLMTITRQALRIGVESYGLKALEAVTGYVRTMALAEASKNLRRLQLTLQRADGQPIDPAWQVVVEQYNEDDCRSTFVLRDYLERERDSMIAGGAVLERPAKPEAVEPSEEGELREHMTMLASSLRASEAPDLGDRAASTLLGDLIGYYDREQKPESWNFYRLAELDDEERLEEREALSGLVYLGRVATPKGRSRTAVDRYSFPPQELKLGAKANLHLDAKTRLGKIELLDVEAGIVEVRKTMDCAEVHPSSCFERTGVSPKAKRESLLREAIEIHSSGFAPSSRASLVRDLLQRLPPRSLPLTRGSLRGVEESAMDAACRLALQLQGTVLPIQGPPGTGKTETAARMILALVKLDRKVGVTATGYAVISNLLLRVQDLSAKEGLGVRVGVQSKDKEKVSDRLKVFDDSADADAALHSLDVLGATAWHWSRVNGRRVEVLFVDEAGQFSLADAVAVCRATDNLVLVGDPQQLDHPTRAAHPDGVAVSVLEHLLEGKPTIEPARGLLLDRTYRLPPAICAYTAEQFYRGQLSPAPGTERRLAASGGSALAAGGMFYVPVEHQGNQSSSREEASAIAELVESLHRNRTQLASAGAPARPLSDEEILVVAPFNAHVTAIRNALKQAGHPKVRVGTVDKFQGQEAPIAIYAMATSHPDDAPRGIEFLYSRHRLNVATSRAQHAAILVASPALLRPNCRTPDELRLASALCRFVEVAQVQQLAAL
jgi:predicted RecB family nuclease